MVLFFIMSGCRPIDKEDTPYNNTVIIIGGGASGMAAGQRLLELGIKPIILEKESTLGGAGIHAGRFLGVNTQWQTQYDIDDTVEAMLEEWQTITGSEPSSRIETFLKNSSLTLDWIHSYGVNFKEPQIDIGAGTAPRIHPISLDSRHPLDIWKDELIEHTFFNTTVSRIETNSNETFQVHSTDREWTARYVIISSGGFSRNTELVESWVPQIIDFDWYTEAWFGMKGDSISWINHFNIPLQNSHNIGLYAHSVPDPILGYPEVMIIPALERSIIVDSNGQRSFDETKTQSLESGQIMLESGPLFAIFDKNSWSGTLIQGLGYNYDPPKVLSGPEYQEYVEVASASDLELLADDLNIPRLAFTNSIQKYNNHFESGDDEFGKDLSNLAPIQTPPFYALPIVISTGKSFGGAQTSPTQSTQIQNLYFIGESAGFLGDPSVGWGFSGSITSCYSQGKTVADTIKTQIDSR